MITIERPQATEHRLQEVTDSSAQYSGLRWAELTSDSEGVEHSSLEKKNVILPNQLGRNSSEERTREERSSRIGEEKVASRYTPSAVSSKLKASFSSRCSYLFTLANSYFRVTGSRIRLLVAAFTGMTGGRLQSLLSLLFSQLSAVGSGLQAISSKLKALIRRQYEQFSLVALASRTLIAGSMVLMLLTVGPMVALEAQSWRQHIAYSIQNMSTKAADQGKKELETPTPSATAQPTPTPNPAPDRQFQVVIPKIGVDSKVIADVDPGNEKEYTKALKEGVAHAKGTGYPGQENSENKTTFLFAHSTNGTWNIARYNALFYGLKDMNTGDDFSLWYKGQEYTYVVTEKKVVEPTDVSFLLPQHEKDQLILQTCWPPGTSAKRLLVIAEAR